MKVSFVNACENEYMAQHDKDNVFFTRKNPNERDKMVIIELAYGEVKSVKVSMHKQRNVKNIAVDQNTRFVTDPHVLVKTYAPIIERVETT